MPVLCLGWQGVSLPATSRSIAFGDGVFSHQRAPSDPYFYADIFVENIVIGSRWMLGYTPSGGAFTELASGTAAAASFAISNVPSYASPMLLELRVRKSSSGTKYLPLRQYAYHAQAGVTMYLAQIVDEVAA